MQGRILCECLLADDAGCIPPPESGAHRRAWSNSSQALAAALLVLAADLDNPGLGTSHASLAKQLVFVLDTLRRSAAPKRGRLAVVQQMTTNGHT